ncbi:MAG: hypothetical protein H7832_10450 [Magnetococcus sp. DMHC-6]
MMGGTCCSGILSDDQQVTIKLESFRKPCWFYRKEGMTFANHELIPDGICPDLFFFVYPHYLSMLYDGQGLNQSNAVTITCPGDRGFTTWRITAPRLPFWPIIELAEKFFRWLGSPKDIYSRMIVMEWIEGSGMCPHGYRPGAKHRFNQYAMLFLHKHKFCPSVFYTLYPLLRKATVPDLLLKQTIQCPSDISALIFSVSTPDQQSNT